MGAQAREGRLFVTGAAEIAVARLCLALFATLANFGPRSAVHQYLCAGSETAGGGTGLVILVRVFRPCERQINPFRISIYRQGRVETTSRTEGLHACQNVSLKLFH